VEVRSRCEWGRWGLCGIWVRSFAEEGRRLYYISLVVGLSESYSRVSESRQGQSSRCSLWQFLTIVIHFLLMMRFQVGKHISIPIACEVLNEREEESRSIKHSLESGDEKYDDVKSLSSFSTSMMHCSSPHGQGGHGVLIPIKRLCILHHHADLPISAAFWRGQKGMSRWWCHRLMAMIIINSGDFLTDRCSVCTPSFTH
jgi:hypothetical protein